jgi:hypothetical protein
MVSVLDRKFNRSKDFASVGSSKRL